MFGLCARTERAQGCWGEPEAESKALLLAGAGVTLCMAAQGLGRLGSPREPSRGQRCQEHKSQPEARYSQLLSKLHCELIRPSGAPISLAWAAVSSKTKWLAPS